MGTYDFKVLLSILFLALRINFLANTKWGYERVRVFMEILITLPVQPNRFPSPSNHLQMAFYC